LFGAGCEKPTAKFRAGDKVRVNAHPETKGVVMLRNGPFKDDLYYLKVPGRPDDRPSTWITTSSQTTSKSSHLEGHTMRASWSWTVERPNQAMELTTAPYGLTFCDN
jgi:hypothetical protein